MVRICESRFARRTDKREMVGENDGPRVGHASIFPDPIDHFPNVFVKMMHINEP